MPEKSKIFSSKVSYKGDFEVTKLYRFVQDWMKDRGYLILEEKNIKEPLTRTEVVRVEWNCIKNLTDYSRANDKLKFFVDLSE